MEILREFVRWTRLLRGDVAVVRIDSLGVSSCGLAVLGCDGLIETRYRYLGLRC